MALKAELHAQMRGSENRLAAVEDGLEEQTGGEGMGIASAGEPVQAGSAAVEAASGSRFVSEGAGSDQTQQRDTEHGY